MKQDVIVSGILRRNDSVLLAKRALNKTIAPGAYHLPGGHVELNENPDDALIREFTEEFSLAIIPAYVIRAFSYSTKITHTIGITYVVDCHDDANNLMFDPHDTESIVWVTKDTFGQYLLPTDHDYITLARYFDN